MYLQALNWPNSEEKLKYLKKYKLSVSWNLRHKINSDLLTIQSIVQHSEEKNNDLTNSRFGLFSL
jgi:hypothetical protein